METYYTDQNGTFFREYKDFLDCRNFEEFAVEQKEWKYADWNTHKEQITKVEAAQALAQLQTLILDQLDRRELHKLIDLLCCNRKIDWHPMEQRNDGVYVMGYPKYPDGLFDIVDFLGHDYNYRLTMGEWPKHLLPTDMDIWQIQTALTYLARAERFCTGAIADAVDDGTLLKLMLRLDDILNAHKGGKQHW